jgi:putative ABC transport system permease protein
MHWKHILKTSLRALAVNKSRSFLTILGIVIGISSIMIIVSLGSGAQNLILGQVQGIGSKTIAVIPGRQPTGASDVTQMFTDSLKQKDVDALRKKENVPEAEFVMPLALGADMASVGNEMYRITIFGTTDSVQKVLDIYPDQGVFFSEDDVKEYAVNIVIGSKVAEKLFENEDPLGQKLRIKGKNFRIIGVLPKKGSGLFNFDEAVLLPYTTAQQYIFGTKFFQRIVIQVISEDMVSFALVNVENTLRNSHGITDPAKDDFFVETPADILDRLGVVTTALTLLLSSLAAISLVVGGIGIMNIMLVSVTERTREIGLRKAIGASEGDILEQFLTEAVLLTSLGGIAGIAFGSALSLLFAFMINKFGGGISWVFVFPWKGALLGVGTTVLMGLLFGIYPAKRAAKMEPIEALRFE